MIALRHELVLAMNVRVLDIASGAKPVGAYLNV